MTILSAFLTAAQKRLSDAGIDNPQLDARLLVCHALGMDRAQLMMLGGRELTAAEEQAIDALIARRAGREPVGRILGLREFWGLPFALNEATLEPRPDTETLVEAALERLSLENLAAPRLLDLGAGTGCILLALLHALPTATGLGIDIAPRAVEQAQENAKRLDLETRAHFRTGNWLEGVTEKFDLIVSNPPYIPTADIATLQPEVRLFDPLVALEGGEDGLTPYRHLIPLLRDRLNPDGWVVFEVGLHQAEAVADLLKEAAFVDIGIRHDLGGVARCVAAKNPR